MKALAVAVSVVLLAMSGCFARQWYAKETLTSRFTVSTCTVTRKERVSVAPGEADAALHLRDRLPDQTEGGAAMAAFVRSGGVELGTRRLQGVEGRLHVGLIRTGFGGSAENGGQPDRGCGGEELAARQSRHVGVPPIMPA